LGGPPPALPELRADGVDYRVFDERFDAYAYSPGLSHALAELTPELDLLHIHGLYLHPTIAAGLAGQRYQVPYIIRPAGSLDPYHLGRKRLKKAVFDLLIHNRVLRHSAAFHFTTTVEQRISQPRIFGRPSIVIPNGFDFSPLSDPVIPGAFRSRFPQIGARLIILFLGRINYKKGFEVLIPAYAQLLRQRSDIHLVIAGNDDGYLGRVRQLIEQFDVSDAVTLPGFLDGQEKREAFADSEIFVLPSYSENFANALFEALAAGLPAVISDRVNSWPEIQAADVGLVVEPEVAPFLGGMKSLLGQGATRAAMAKRAIEFARANYSWDSIVIKLEAAYYTIVADAAEQRGKAEAL
jgi:glycosyltransferase involved in cell wall biosynthesis